MTKIKKTPKQDDRKAIFIKDKELDDKTIFKLIEIVLNSKIKGNMIFVIVWVLLFYP